jgi:hypothetical protein
LSAGELGFITLNLCATSFAISKYFATVIRLDSAISLLLDKFSYSRIKAFNKSFVLGSNVVNLLGTNGDCSS